MNRFALLLAISTFFATAHVAVAQTSQPTTFSGNPGICMVHPLADARIIPGSEAWDRREEIRAGTDGVCANFNGAFTVVTWDCKVVEGTCETGVIVDRTDGKIYPLPARATMGYEYHGESNMLVVNAYISQSYDSPTDIPLDMWRTFYLFSHGKWIPIFQDKGFVPSGD